MKRKNSIILFGLSFLIALLGEVYLLNMDRIDIFSVIGIGIVVVLTGYLWMDSIFGLLSSNNQKRNLLWEEGLKELEEREITRYTELINLQKATYTALKKSNQSLQEEIDHLKQIQQKVMDGQTKALNISVNYSREHTKELINAIKAESSDVNYEEQLSLILSLLENQNQTKEQEISEDIKTDDELKPTDATNIYNDEDSQEDENKEAELDIKPLYDDPNAALTADEIAQLFNSYGK